MAVGRTTPRTAYPPIGEHPLGTSDVSYAGESKAPDSTPPALNSTYEPLSGIPIPCSVNVIDPSGAIARIGVAERERLGDVPTPPVP